MSTGARAPSLEDLLAHAGWARALARRLVEDAAAADDLVQEAWLAALRRPPAAGTPVRPWLARVLRNAARQRARGEGRRRAREARVALEAGHGTAGGDSPAEIATRFETSRLLAELVAGLEPPYREVVLRRYWEDHPASRIARDLGLPAGTVRWRLAEARRRLREALDARHGGDSRAWATALIPLALRAPGPALAVAPALPATLAGVLAMSGAFKTLAAALLVVLAAAGAVLYGPDLLDAARPEAPEDVQFRPLPPPEAAAEAPAGDLAPPDAGRRPLAAAEDLPADGVLVTARILDASRAPIPGAILTAGGRQERDARSDAAGGIQLLLERPADTSEQSFVVQAPGHATRLLTGVLRPAAPLPLGDVILEPGGDVSGRVVDSSGSPVEGAWVRAGEATGRHRDLERERRGPQRPQLEALGARTGPDGRFHLAGVPVGMTRIWAGKKELLAAYSRPVEVRASTESSGVELVLEPFPDAELIEGIVLDPAGAPLPRARLRYSHRSLLGSSSGSLSAGRDGRFRIQVRPGRDYDLEARDRAGVLAAARLEGVPAGTRDVELRLHEARSLRLRVVDGHGSPVERYAVTLWNADRTHVFDYQAPAGRPAGACTLSLPDAACQVEVESPGFARGRAGPFPAEGEVPAEVEVALVALPGVTGLVRAGGKPVAGATVGLHREVPATRVVIHNGFPVFQEPDATSAVKTDEEGRFSITLRERGRFRIRAEAAGFAPAELGPFDLDPAKGLQGLELVLTEGGAIEGVLTPADGTSPAGRIAGISRGDGYARTQRLGTDGRFRFEHLLPGPWQVELRETEIYAGASRTESRPGRREIPSNCIVAEGETTFFDLGSGAPQGAVEGTLWLDGAPAQGWTALVMPAGAAMTSEEPRALDTLGRFRQAVPRPGRYRIVLRGPEEEFSGLVLLAEVELAAGTTPWSADLDLGRLTVTGAPPGSPPLTPLALTGGDLRSVLFVAPLAAGPEGRAALRVPAGPARIVRARWTDPESAPDRWPTVMDVEVPAGGIATVDLSHDG